MLNFWQVFEIYQKKNVKDLLNLIYDYYVNNDFYNQIIDDLITSFMQNYDDNNILMQNARMTIIERKVFI